MKLVSACLIGRECRYDGKSKRNEDIIGYLKKHSFISVCPEKLGRLQIPREPAEQSNGKVYTKTGEDVTSNFIDGAYEVLKISREYGITEAILKQRSPSCGCGQIPEGSFSGKTIKGDGVTTALLKKNGIKVISEEDI